MSTLIACPDCDEDVSTRARICPHCGRRLRADPWRWVIGLAVVGLVGMGIIFGVYGTLSPCGILKAEFTRLVTAEAGKELTREWGEPGGMLGSALAGMVLGPIIEAETTKLGPARCAYGLVRLYRERDALIAEFRKGPS